MKKTFFALGLAAVFALSTACAMAETAIYTDGIGRLHFLGRDAANNKAGAGYTNPAAQDLTRKLYENNSGEVINDVSYEQHPLKNYENTFSDSTFTNWRKKYAAEAKPSEFNAEEVRKKSTATATKGAMDASNFTPYGSTVLDNPFEEKTQKTEKKHWWNKKK